jgi:antitoxin (DNA-binding transcriptional repressor) of toxin-antitoxin stability system
MRTYANIIVRDKPMQITASKLRENIYRILDQAIATGAPVEVLRKGTVLRIVPEKRASKLDRLKKRTGFDGDPDDIIGMDWLKEWTELG